MQNSCFENVSLKKYNFYFHHWEYYISAHSRPGIFKSVLNCCYLIINLSNLISDGEKEERENFYR